jgi:tetratricopeptide (TPR) repeat protein
VISELVDMTSKLEQAKHHVQKAEKALKKNYLALKFSADYMTASAEYSEAAQLFGLAGAQDDAKVTWIKAAESRLKENDHFSAGRCYESASEWEKAAECFMLASKLDAAARVLLKQAQNEPGKVDECFEKVIAMYTDENDDKAVLAVDVYRQYLAKIGLLDLEKTAKVGTGFMELLKRLEHWPFVHKEILTLVIIALIQGDTVKAEKHLEASMGSVKDWLKSSECRLAEDLVQSIKEQDAELLAATVKKQTLTYLRPDIVRLARTLKVSEHHPVDNKGDKQPVDESELLR